MKNWEWLPYQPSKVCLAKLHGYLILLTFEKVVVFMIQNQRQNERIVSNFQIVMKEETRNLSFGVTTYYYTWHLSFTSPPTGLFTLATSITKEDEVNFLPLFEIWHVGRTSALDCTCQISSQCCRFYRSWAQKCQFYGILQHFNSIKPELSVTLSLEIWHAGWISALNRTCKISCQCCSFYRS